VLLLRPGKFLEKIMNLMKNSPCVCNYILDDLLVSGFPNYPTSNHKQKTMVRRCMSLKPIQDRDVTIVMANI